MIRRPPRSTLSSSSAASDVYKRQETAEGVEQSGKIAAVEGIDVLWIGHFDLTISLGIAGQFSHPAYLRAVDRVLDACLRHGKTPGIMAADVETARFSLGQGFRAVAYGGDLWIYGQALAHGIATIRNGCLLYT